uniref:Uncharacterized protein n=1 Tax=Cacopsylla melanoneura TaxID=428564 RepID=A0A8D9BKN1_9HEMI
MYNYSLFLPINHYNRHPLLQRQVKHGSRSFCFNFKAFSDLMSFMERHFSSADQAIIVRSHAKARFLFRTLSAACTLTFVGALMEPFFPVSAEETQRLAYIYKRSRPERRLPTNFWIPFFDDSQSPTYEIVFAVEIYLICVEIVQNIISASVIPMLVSYMMGQYKIICKYAAMVGRTHRNSNGEVIYYTNIERNEFVIQTRRIRLRMCQDEYDQVFVGQLVRFHQKLIKFQKMVSLDFWFRLV